MHSIRTPTSRFKLQPLAADDFPTLPSLSLDSPGGVPAVEIPFSDFRRMVAKVLFAVSAEERQKSLEESRVRQRRGGGPSPGAAWGRRWRSSAAWRAGSGGSSTYVAAPGRRRARPAGAAAWR